MTSNNIEPYPGYSGKFTTWSYAEFLATQRNKILMLPPFLNEWFHLDGRWVNRFLVEARNLDPDNFNNIVRSERANKTFQIYWEGIIYERKEMQTNRIHLSTSMDFLGIACNQNFQQITSRGYLKTFPETSESGATSLQNNHVHSYIICDHDEKVKALFSEDDWTELTKKPLLPSVEYEVGKELAKYMKENLIELRQEVMCNFLKEGEVYDPKEHYIKEWIQLTLRHLCNLYENLSFPLCREQYEDWFTVNLFGICFDFLMRHPRMSTDIKRTDALSTASANRKNRARQFKQRKLTGRKIDGIIHHPTYNLELAAIEAAKSFVNYGDKKYLTEYFKMPKTLKDILVDMIRTRQCANEKVNQLVAIGILHFRYNIQFARLWKAGGSVCIFSRDDVYSISDHFSRAGILDFLKFLKAIVRSQITIENNLKILGLIEPKTSEKEDFEEKDLISEILNDGQDVRRTTLKDIIKADCFPTPNKRKSESIKTKNGSSKTKRMENKRRIT
ncbi:5675_t:CDS:2 [Cetraspora pellucida]|uniref:5675_t:CDS:1 n=1 Tax=Cetraspora pellucida TaxID=1433469 RepID=A0A9N9CJB7_9GLOM|nr:5675_t:CDS:2 [Cetraspora pellucida]